MQSHLVLSKSDGSIIQSSGLVRQDSTPQGSSSVSSPEPQETVGNGNTYTGSKDLTSPQEGSNTGDAGKKGNTAEEVAKMVYAFVTAAKGFAEGMDAADEVKLLRMRTRKNEIVIVPGESCTVTICGIPRLQLIYLQDAKFLLVVIHDTPPA